MAHLIPIINYCGIVFVSWTIISRQYWTSVLPSKGGLLCARVVCKALTLSFPFSGIWNYAFIDVYNSCQNYTTARGGVFALNESFKWFFKMPLNYRYLIERKSENGINSLYKRCIYGRICWMHPLLVKCQNGRKLIVSKEVIYSNENGCCSAKRL